MMSLVPQVAASARPEEEEEEIEDLPEAEKSKDPLRLAEVTRSFNGQNFVGRVDDIEVGKVTRERLYRIKYEDGDLEHLTAEQVRECMVRRPGREARSPRSSAPSPTRPLPTAEAKAGPLKKPASAMTMEDVVEDVEEDEGAEEEDVVEDVEEDEG